MRIEGGEKKGFTIKTPKDIRPTSSFLKKSIFDTIGDYILDKEVLEVFAGSGALGLEAISRGAKRCVFVDISRSSQKAISENVKNLEYQDRALFIKSDAIKFLRNCEYQFDIIIADPPYDYRNYNELLKTAHSKLKDNGMLIVQLSSKANIKLENYRVYKDYKKGGNRVLFLIKS